MRLYIYSFWVLFVTIVLHTSCDDNLFVQGAGSFELTLNRDDVQSEVITRALSDIDVNAFKVTLCEADGTTLLDEKNYGLLTEAECTLPAAVGYQLKVENCTPYESVTLNEGWGMPHFKGETTFDIVSDQLTQVSLSCSMDNVGLQLLFSQSFLDKFPIHAGTIQDNRSLVFNQITQEQVAYYSVEGDAIEVELRLTGSAGGWTDRLDLVYNLTLSKGKIYVVNVTYSDNHVRCEGCN